MAKPKPTPRGTAADLTARSDLLNHRIAASPGEGDHDAAGTGGPCREAMWASDAASAWVGLSLDAIGPGTARMS
jgi:hypothetical protein